MSSSTTTASSPENADQNADQRLTTATRIPLKNRRKKIQEIENINIEYVQTETRWVKVYKNLLKVQRLKPFRTKVLKHGEQVFNNLCDVQKQKDEEAKKAKRLQTNLSEKNPFVKKLEEALINIGELKAPLKIKNPRIMASLKGCAEQDFHYDYDPHLVNDFAKRLKIKPKIVVLAMKSGTKILLKDPKTVSSCVEIVLNCGDCCVFDGDIIHAGDWYDCENIRLHMALEFDGLTSSDNTVFVPKNDWFYRVDYDHWLENSSWQIQIQEKIELIENEKKKVKKQMLNLEKDNKRVASYYDLQIKKAEDRVRTLKKRKEEKSNEFKKKRQRLEDQDANFSNTLKCHETFINTMEKRDALRQKAKKIEEEAKKLEEGLRNDKDSEEILNNLMEN